MNKYKYITKVVDGKPLSKKKIKKLHKQYEFFIDDERLNFINIGDWTEMFDANTEMHVYDQFLTEHIVDKVPVIDFETLWLEVEENFKWKRVHKTMKYLNWEWQEHGVPSKKQIKAQAKRLLKYSFDTGNATSTGGLYASCDEDGLLLQFVLDSWDVFYE